MASEPESSGEVYEGVEVSLRNHNRGTFILSGLLIHAPSADILGDDRWWTST
jgi:hypothetical protein